jgi:hypothetical protein
MYADFAGYLELGTLDYTLEIRDETGEATVAAYEAPLARFLHCPGIYARVKERSQKVGFSPKNQ